MTPKKRYLFFFSLASTVSLLIPVFMMETVARERPGAGKYP